MPKSDQGIHADRYLIIPRTLVFLFNDRDEVLLIQGAADKRLWAGLYNGIGGHVEQGEDILTAAERELLEETGLRNIRLSHCGQIMVDVSPEKGVAIFIFCGIVATEKKLLQTSEEGTLHWVPLDSLGDYDLVEDLYILIPEIRKRSNEKIFLVGRYAYGEDEEMTVLIR